jgi:hypothetical protein
VQRRNPTHALQRKEFLVLTEGSKTEAIYLKFWERECRDRALVHLPEVRYTDPMSLVSEAARMKKESEAEERKRRGKSYDEVWCVFDVDQHPRIPDALEKARANNIKVAISNPCIELWFVLHLKEQSAAIGGQDVQRVSRELLQCEKALTDDALAALHEHHQLAVERAQGLSDRHTSGGSKRWENPSSTVWELIEAIRSA